MLGTVISWEGLFDLRLMGESLAPVVFVVVYSCVCVCDYFIQHLILCLCTVFFLLQMAFC